ncbi:hypothetical protein DMB42_40345 [Nonomuraea sp. WAC 01424]|nr:hypothetical protein DMB42_40345 [Nonomuraea sp. WAC 01424]
MFESVAKVADLAGDRPSDQCVLEHLLTELLDRESAGRLHCRFPSRPSRRFLTIPLQPQLFLLDEPSLVLKPPLLRDLISPMGLPLGFVEDLRELRLDLGPAFVRPHPSVWGTR